MPIFEVAVVKLSIEELLEKFKEDQTRGTILDMNICPSYQRINFILNIHCQSLFSFKVSNRSECRQEYNQILGILSGQDYSHFRKVFGSLVASTSDPGSHFFGNLGYISEF